jgi:hypothetical protein
MTRNPVRVQLLECMGRHSSVAGGDAACCELLRLRLSPKTPEDRVRCTLNADAMLETDRTRDYTEIEQIEGRQLTNPQK